MTETIFSCVIGSSKVSVAHPANIMMMILLTLALALDVTGTVSSVSDAADALAVPSVEESSVHHSVRLTRTHNTASFGRTNDDRGSLVPLHPILTCPCILQICCIL